MTYIPVNRILVHIPNKFEAIKVAALECRRLNEQLQAMEDVDDHEEKITTMAVQRLMDGEVTYHDARERREQERSEAMLAAAEEMLDMTAPTAATLAELGGLPEEDEAAPVTAPAPETAKEEPKAEAAAEPTAEVAAEPTAEAADEAAIDEPTEDDDELEMVAEADETAVEEIAEEPKD